MANNTWVQAYTTLQAAGPTLTTGANVQGTLLNGQAQLIFPANQLRIGDGIRVKASGIISCVATTPGSALFALVNTTASVTLFSTGALNLNTTAKTNVPWDLEIDLTVRTVGSGTSATVIGVGKFTSEAVVGSAANTAGGNGTLMAPVSGASVSSGFSSSTSFAIDFQFQQAVTTGSITCEQYKLFYET